MIRIDLSQLILSLREEIRFPIPGLIQIASQNSICCIDTVAITDLDPLINFLNSTRRTLIFHATRQDIEVLIPLGLRSSAVIFDAPISRVILRFEGPIRLC